MKFQKFLIWKTSQFFKIAIIAQLKKKFTNFQNLTIFFKFYYLESQYFTISRIIIYLRVQIVSKKWKKKFENKIIE